MQSTGNDHWHGNRGMAKCLEYELVCVRVWNVGMMEFWRLRWTWKLVYIDRCCCCCYDRYSNRDLLRVDFGFQFTKGEDFMTPPAHIRFDE